MNKKILLILLLFFSASFLYNNYFYEPKVLSGYEEGEFLKVIFFDVGQGDASLVLLPSGEKILIDGGPDKKLLYKLPPYLKDKKIDYLILTHPHADHLASFPEILKRYNVSNVILTGVIHATSDYLDFLSIIKDQNILTVFIEEPGELIIGDSILEFLAPKSSMREKKISNLNNSSIVFRLLYKNNSILFTGDYEEEELLLKAEDEIESQILKVSHHGANNGNDKDFLEIVSPEYAVISVGKNNKFGHPGYRTIYYLEELKTKILRTDEVGDIIFIGDGEEFKQL